MNSERGIWFNMIARCHNKADSNYHNYGARGIFVCEAWRKSYMQFVQDVDTRPTPKHSLERIDNDKGCCKDNCRWALPIEQGQNKRWIATDRSGLVGVTCEDIEGFGYWRARASIGGKIKQLYAGWDKAKAVEARMRWNNKTFDQRLNSNSRGLLPNEVYNSSELSV